MACFKKWHIGRYLKTFSIRKPGGRPKPSKLLRKFRYRPKRVTASIKISITLLVITRILLSLLPMELRPLP